MSAEIIVAIISSIIGVTLGAILNHLLAEKKDTAEIEKLIAEADKAKAEADKARAEIAKELNRSTKSSERNTTGALSPENGILEIYFPKTNAERNSRKEDVILAAERKIQLLASTGHSYLAMVGNRFKGALVNRLQIGVQVQIILLNPWSDSAVFWAFGEYADNKPRGKPPSAIELIRKGILDGFDPVALIKDSIYYRRKLPESIEGYLNLRKDFEENISLRFIDREIVATILLTDKISFFEPYITANLQERMQNLMHTFELEFTRKSYFVATCQAYFDTLWKLSITYDDFTAKEDLLKSRLKQRYLRG